MFEHYSHIAASHRRLAATASTPNEQAHWQLEAERFEGLSELARTNPQAARAAYRPTLSYEPMPTTPIVSHYAANHGDLIEIWTLTERDGRVVDGDCIATATHHTGDYDDTTADTAIASLGYRRTGDWASPNGTPCADVVPA